MKKNIVDIQRKKDAAFQKQEQLRKLQILKQQNHVVRNLMEYHRDDITKLPKHLQEDLEKRLKLIP